MMKGIAFLLAITELSAEESSARRLLQFPQFPSVPRPQQPGAPAPPSGGGGGTTVVIPGGQGGGWGAAPAPVPNIPAPQPWGGVQVPAPAPWGGNSGYYTTAPPTLQMGPLVPPFRDIFKCEAGAMGPCAGSYLTIPNPLDGFSLECSAQNACKGSEINIKLDAETTNIAWFSGLKCSSPAACYGTTVRFDNNQFGGHSLEVERIECNGAGACNNMEVILGHNTQLMEFVCNAGECDFCTVKLDPRDPGMSCYVMAMQALKYPA